MRHLLGLQDLSPQEIEGILRTAAAIKAGDLNVSGSLRGRIVVTLFFEPSTRTRTSFELAARRMDAQVVHFDVGTSSVVKGESLLDTIYTLEAMGVDLLVVRHQASGAAHFISRHTGCAVVNAGDGMHEHPTQGLLDLFTIQEHKGCIEGLRVAIVGDILHSRVARSDLFGLTKLGAEVTLCGPSTLLPRDRSGEGSLPLHGVRITDSLDEALEGADVVIALRLQRERQQSGLIPSLAEYTRFWGIDASRLSRCKPDVLVMHPGPMNLGVEILPGAAYGPWSVIREQVTNGVYVRMAVLYHLLAKGGENQPQGITEAHGGATDRSLLPVGRR
ncbi:MAG: aspartate carbamoyltransferase catalytic subunit [Armatimonadota bacterium]|nr:aspartate carbamoyltransferase catalytic subunit [Armatimonadota bacterium]MDR5702209.1 aspartate carbamoyltransferase catalytic subunit [Armatimonadota bacterium]